MLDKNGKELRVGQIVRIENSYFKNDIGTYVVAKVPGFGYWTGKDCCLYRIKKDMSFAKTNRIAFFPLCVFVNDREKAAIAKAYNKKNATIEIIGISGYRSFRIKKRLRKWQYKTSRGMKISMFNR